MEAIFQNPWVFLPLLLWSLAWKGVALWKAARLESKPWFIAILIINTVGILEILYIFIFSKMKQPAYGQETLPEQR